MDNQAQLDQLIGLLLRDGAIDRSQWPSGLTVDPQHLGLAPTTTGWTWQIAPEVFDQVALARALPDCQVTCFSHVDSTNTQLVRLGQHQPIAGTVYLAEFQHGGKGRRGRQWISPYGRNLAISMGFATGKSLNELGGLSLVVGLAVAEVFENIGVADVAVKWPNDMLISGRKAGGILVELLQHDKRTEFVVGLGVNVSLTDEEIEAIGQPVTDLRRAAVTASRTLLAGKFVQVVTRYLHHFEEQGFASFVSAFNDLHLYHGKTCTLIHGDQQIVGTVSGIGLNGELILQTQQGERLFHGGEVSLRPVNS